MTELTGEAGAVFGAYVSEQLLEERARKTSLEARGLALITTSGAFTTLVLGIAALAGGDNLPDVSRVLLILSLAAFLIAAVMGVVVNKPADYDEPSADSLRDTLARFGDRDRATGEKTVADSRLDVLKAARQRNETKAERLLWGAWAQIAALGSVAVAGIVTLLA